MQTAAYFSVMETIEVDGCVQGHHVYSCIRIPTLGEELQWVTEDSNDKDPYVVAVMKWDIVGHVLRLAHTSVYAHTI